MAEPRPEKKRQKAKPVQPPLPGMPPSEAPGTARVLPMELRVGDRLVDETGEWEVIGRPYTTAGGKSARVRVQRVGEPYDHHLRTHAAHLREPAAPAEREPRLREGTTGPRIDPGNGGRLWPPDPGGESAGGTTPPSATQTPPTLFEMLSDVKNEAPETVMISGACLWLRGSDLNRRPLGYEPNELPGCSTPR